MGNELQVANSKELMLELNTEFAVIDNKQLAKISERMKEMDRTNNSFSKGKTQTTSQLMT